MNPCRKLDPAGLLSSSTNLAAFTYSSAISMDSFCVWLLMFEEKRLAWYSGKILPISLIVAGKQHEILPDFQIQCYSIFHNLGQIFYVPSWTLMTKVIVFERTNKTGICQENT